MFISCSGTFNHPAKYRNILLCQEVTSIASKRDVESSLKVTFWNSGILKKLIVTIHAMKLPPFMQPMVLLPCSQDPEPAEST
jgi:hypothetical protein